MKYVLIIPYRDMAQAAPCLWAGALEAPDRDTAWERTRAIMNDAVQLLDLLVGRDAYDDMEDLKGLTRDDLLRAYGLVAGEPQLWAEDDFCVLEPMAGVGV